MISRFKPLFFGLCALRPNMFASEGKYTVRESLERKLLSTFDLAARQMAAAGGQRFVLQLAHLLRVRPRRLPICSREAGERRRGGTEKDREGQSKRDAEIMERNEQRGWKGGRQRWREGERRMQTEAPHTRANRDSPVSVATAEKLIARALLEAQRCLPVSHTACSALPAGPCVASVCCGGEGAVNQQLGRHRLQLKLRSGPVPQAPPPPTLHPHPAPTPPRSPSLTSQWGVGQHQTLGTRSWLADQTWLVGVKSDHLPRIIMAVVMHMLDTR